MEDSVWMVNKPVARVGPCGPSENVPPEDMGKRTFWNVRSVNTYE